MEKCHFTVYVDMYCLCTCVGGCPFSELHLCVRSSGSWIYLYASHWTTTKVTYCSQGSGFDGVRSL